MSGSARAGGGHDHGGGGGQLYEDHQPANGSVPFDVLGDGKDDAGSAFFQNSACGGGGDAPGFTPSYASITDYLQGLVDPAGLARHLDAPPVYATAGQELSVGDMIGHDDRHGRQAGRGCTPNSSTSGEQEDEERRQCKRGSADEGDQGGEIDEEKSSADHQNPTRSDTKKKTGKVEKKARGSRVAFATKSEVDHLDDGYRWRKYGQKAVKNSSFPRSYYRCTAARCGVKKQVERSQKDPSTVVTTYEGQHAHPSPAAARGMATGLYSMASLQQQRHGFCPSSPDDIFLAAARAMVPPAAAASPAFMLPHQAEHRFAEYYGMQLQDVLLDPLAGNQHGHR